MCDPNYAEYILDTNTKMNIGRVSILVVQYSILSLSEIKFLFAGPKCVNLEALISGGFQLTPTRKKWLLAFPFSVNLSLGVCICVVSEPLPKYRCSVKVISLAARWRIWNIRKAMFVVFSWCNGGVIKVRPWHSMPFNWAFYRLVSKSDKFNAVWSLTLNK